MSKKRGHAEASSPEGFDDQPSRDQQPRKRNKNNTPRQSAALHQNQAIERSYDHPIIAHVAPILTSDKTLNEKHDAIKLMLARASPGKSSKTVELKCPKCGDVDDYQLSAPPTTKGPWTCTIYLAAANSIRKQAALMDFLKTFKIECHRCKLTPLPAESTPSLVFGEFNRPQSTSSQSRDLAAVASPVSSSVIEPTTPGSSRQKPKDWGVKSIQRSSGRKIATRGKTGFAKHLPSMNTVGQQAVVLGLYATKVLRCPQLAQMCYGMASDQRPVDATAIGQMDEEEHAQIHALSTNMKTSSDHAVRPRTETSRDVEENTKYVFSHDLAWIEKAGIIPEKADENGKTANMACVDVETTPYNDLKVKLRLAFVEPIPGTKEFRVWWFFTFGSKPLESAVPLEADRRAFLRVLEVTAESPNPFQSRDLYVTEGSAKSSYLKVAPDVLPYSVAMAPADGSLTPGSKAFLKACDMQLDHEKHEQYAQAVQANGFSQGLLDVGPDMFRIGSQPGEAAVVRARRPQQSTDASSHQDLDDSALSLPSSEDDGDSLEDYTPLSGPSLEMSASTPPTDCNPEVSTGQHNASERSLSLENAASFRLSTSHTALDETPEEEGEGEEGEEAESNGSAGAIAPSQELPKSMLTEKIAGL